MGFFGTIETAMVDSFVPLWALRELGISTTQVGLMFVAAAVLGVVIAPLAGLLSDHVGRRPVILAAIAVEAASLGSFLSVRSFIPVLVAFAIYNGATAAAGGVSMPLIADVTPPDDREEAFSATRIVINLGSMLGPVLGAGLILMSWDALFIGGTAALILMLVVAAAFLPGSGAYAGDEDDEGDEHASIGTLLSDRTMGIYLVATFLASVVIVAEETVLPVSLVQTHGISLSTWGLLFAINPILVVIFQARVSRSARRVRLGVRLPLAVAVMGLAFLPLALSTAIPFILVMITVFVFGEMVFAPASMAIVTELAPDRLRGAYLGAGHSLFTAALAVGPMLAYQARGEVGDLGMWGVIGAIALSSAVFYAVVAHRLTSRSEGVVEVDLVSIDDRAFEPAPRARNLLTSPLANQLTSDRGRRRGVAAGTVALAATAVVVGLRPRRK